MSYDLAEVKNLPAYKARDCDELARHCSQGRVREVLVPIADVQAKLQQTGAWWAIKALTVAPEHPAHAAAVAVTDVASARYTNLNMALPIVQFMFGALVQAGALTQDALDEITALSVEAHPYSPREIALELFNDDATEK